MQQELSKIAGVRFSAMSFLALREHSVKELKDKLARRYDDADLVDRAIESLIEQDLQSDERFTRAFISMRQRQGKGPIIIKMELRDRGISGELIAEFLDINEPLWVELAREVRRKKFSELPPADQWERARQMRFLNARGFSGHQIQSAFSSVSEDEY